jgi:hypothetical protein
MIRFLSAKKGTIGHRRNRAHGVALSLDLFQFELQRQSRRPDLLQLFPRNENPETSFRRHEKPFCPSD